MRRKKWNEQKEAGGLTEEGMIRGWKKRRQEDDWGNIRGILDYEVSNRSSSSSHRRTIVMVFPCWQAEKGALPPFRLDLKDLTRPRCTSRLMKSTKHVMNWS